MLAGIQPIFVEDVQEFIPPVERIHEHPDAGEQRPILHGEAIGYFLLLLPSVVQSGVDCGDGVAAKKVVELIMAVDDVVVDVLGVQLGVELGGDVVGQVLELLDDDGDEVLGAVEEGLDGHKGVGVRRQDLSVESVDGDAVVVELQHPLHVVVLQPVQFDPGGQFDEIVCLHVQFLYVLLQSVIEAEQ